MAWFTQFLGRLHPLLVHLPIGILILAFLFECLSRIKAYRRLKFAIRPALLVGAAFAVAAAFSGYFLAQEGGYDGRLLDKHETLGIATAIFSVVVYVLYSTAGAFFQEKSKRKTFYMVLFVPLTILVSLTGHFGGSMTHGEDYLFDFVAGTEAVTDPSVKLQNVANLEEAVLYEDIVQPILEARCYSCHSSRKQKGELRLDDIAAMARGGEHGSVFEPGNADSSSLFVRLMLPLEDEDHMPPNEKPQPSSSEIALIQVWINEGADFTKKISDCRDHEKIKNYLTAVVEQSRKQRLIPEQDVEAPDEKIVSDLNKAGVIVLPVGRETNYVSVSFVNKRSVSTSDLQALLPLKKQIVWLDLGRTTVSDSTINIVTQLSVLRRLNAEYTAITDQALKTLSALSELRYINLVGTKVTDEGLQQLTALKNLESVFVYQTAVTASGIDEYLASSPKTVVDTGGYQLPKVLEDSVIKRKR